MHDCEAIFFWQPIVSIVTILFFKSKTLNSSGIAVISFDFSDVLNCPRTSSFLQAHALTIWIAGLLIELSKEWPNVLPSIAIISPALKSKTEFTHDRKQLLNCSGHSLKKKLLLCHVKEYR